MASSADGDKLVAVMGGGDGAIYTSTDAGLTWHKTFAAVDDYDCVASSADRTKLVAASNYGQGIYVSSNSGATWVNAYNGRQYGGEFWRSVAMSADGKTMVAAEAEGYVAGYPPSRCMLACSTNSGLSWWISSAPTNQLWWAVACSTNGTFMVAAALESYASSPVPGPIYVSHDSGANWTATTAPLATWGSLACSADGTRVTAGTTAAEINTTIGACYSIDSGTNWTVDTNLFGADFLASSADGSKRVAAESYLYVSHTQPGFSIPKLNIARSGKNVLLYWVTNQFGVSLQQETNLAAPNWITMTNIPVISNGQNQVLVLPSNRQNFFRLGSP